MDTLSKTMQDLEAAFSAFQKAELMQIMVLEYARWDQAYQDFNAQYSPAYLSGSPWYWGQRLPCVIFQAMVLVLAFDAWHSPFRYDTLALKIEVD